MLFVDVVGFTRLMEGVPPQLTINFLRAFHEHMAACIFRHGGTLDKFIGDGVMATFGTPDAQPDDEARALALRARHGEDGRGLELRPPHARPAAVRISVGVHVGPVLMGAIGSRNRLEYSRRRRHGERGEPAGASLARPRRADRHQRRDAGRRRDSAGFDAADASASAPSGRSRSRAARSRSRSSSCRPAPDPPAGISSPLERGLLKQFA